MGSKRLTPTGVVKMTSKCLLLLLLLLLWLLTTRLIIMSFWYKEHVSMPHGANYSYIASILHHSYLKYCSVLCLLQYYIMLASLESETNADDIILI